MLSTEIKVNGNLISYIYSRRSLQTEINDEYIYKYEYYQPEIGKLITGQVIHSIEDGINELIFKILKSVRKKKKQILKRKVIKQ